MIRIFCTLIILTLFSFSLSAEIKVSWGNGSLNIFDQDNKNSDKSEKIKLLETELLIEESLSSHILSSSRKTLHLQVNVAQLSAKKLKEEITIAISKYQPIEKPKDPDKESKDKNFEGESQNDVSGVLVFDHRNSLIVSGDEKVIIKKGELVEHLIVLGGEAQIDGEVKTLILIKGKVSIGEGGRITEKVKELSGTIKVQAGGFVTPNKSGVLDGFDISGSLIDGLLDFRGWKLKISSILFRLLQTLFVFWLSFRVIPYVKDELFEQKQDWGYSMLTGFLQLFIMPFVIFALTISIIGISLIPIYFCLIYFMGLFGYGFISAILGRKIIDMTSDGVKSKSKYLYFFVGFFIWELLISIPTFGYLILSALVFVSIGLSQNIYSKRVKNLTLSNVK